MCVGVALNANTIHPSVDELVICICTEGYYIILKLTSVSTTSNHKIGVF